MSVSQWRQLNPFATPVGLIQLGLTEETPDWAGVSYPGEEVGRTAIDMVVAQIHRGECGVPSFQKVSLVEGRWIDGATCPPKAELLRRS